MDLSTTNSVEFTAENLLELYEDPEELGPVQVLRWKSVKWKPLILLQ